MTSWGGRDGAAAAGRAVPVADNELEGLFAILRGYRCVILAVSGGADSMALMHLAARWRRMNDRSELPKLEVATVDHGLRSDSGAEARWVGAAARALGYRQTTLAWTDKKPATGIEEAAREARYRLLLDHARARGERVAVVTAHNEDDQAETLLMRLARGSGIDGLSSMAALRHLAAGDHVDLVRPLLGLSRRRLVATLRAADVTWAEDSSNACLDFERVRLRAAQASLAALGLTNDKLALSARRLARAKEVVDRALEELSAIVDLNGGILAVIERERFRGAPAELRVRLLMRALRAFGGEARPPRLQQVEALTEQLSCDEPTVASTLGGCIIRASARAIRVYREADPARLPEIALQPGGDVLWDRRFRISAAPVKVLRAAGVGEELTLRALGAGAYATLRKRIDRKIRAPVRALHTLPSVWAGGKLIAVPQLGIRVLGPDASGSRGPLCSSVFVAWEPEGKQSGAFSRERPVE